MILVCYFFIPHFFGTGQGKLNSEMQFQLAFFFLTQKPYLVDCLPVCLTRLYNSIRPCSVSIAYICCVQLTLEQYMFEPCGSYTWIFFNKHVEKFWRFATNGKNIFFSRIYCIVRLQYIIYVTSKICVFWLFMLLVRLLVNTRLYCKVLGESKITRRFLVVQEVGTLNLHIVHTHKHT